MVTIIPAKPFSQSKTRLAPVLSQKQRIRLSQHLLRRTIGLAIQVGQVVVISLDHAVRRFAKQAGAWTLVESGADLNSAIRQASEWVTARGGQSVLILPTDLPLLTMADLTEITKLGDEGASVVIAPCHREDGTNALLLSPPGAINVAFGPDSFRKHQHAAQSAGITPTVYHSPTVAFDLDLPEDLALLNKVYRGSEFRPPLPPNEC